MRLKNYCLILTLTLAACQPTLNSRGNLIAEQKFNSFVIGHTTMNDVIEVCGTPSLHKDNFTWIYISGVAEETSFKGINMSNRAVVRLIFDSNHVLKDKSIDRPNKQGYKINPAVTDLLSEKEIH